MGNVIDTITFGGVAYDLHDKNVGDTENLVTEAKNIVDAINEIAQGGNGSVNAVFSEGDKAIVLSGGSSSSVIYNEGTKTIMF